MMIAAQSKLRQKGIDITTGPIFGKVIMFVIPLMLSNLLQVFYNAADMMIVSLSSESNAVGAIGMTGSFTGLIVNMFMGFSAGSNVIVARFIGAKDKDNVSKTVHTAIIMSLMVGVLGLILGVAVSRPILSWMGAQGKLLDLAVKYTTIYFLGVPFISMTNYLSSIFRAKGDTKTPLYVLSASGLVNVGLNFFFVLVCDMSVEGVAIATAVANILSAATLLWILSKDESSCRFYFSKLRIDKRAFFGILREGLPAGIQSALFSVSNMIIQSSIIQVNYMLTPAGSPYDPVVNGNAAAANLEGFIYTAVNSVYHAAITFTSQNVGATKYKRVWRVILVCNLFGMSVGLLGTIILNVFKSNLLALYGVVDGAVGTLEHIAYTAANERIIYVMSLYFIIALLEANCGILRGLGKSTLSTIISLLGACAFRVLWVEFVFGAFPSLKTVYISYPISWLLTGGAELLFSIFFLNRLIKKQKAEQEIKELCTET